MNELHIPCPTCGDGETRIDGGLEWLIEENEKTRDRVLQFMQSYGDGTIEGYRVTLSVEPMRRRVDTQRGLEPIATIRQTVPVAAGVKALGWSMRRACKQMVELLTGTGLYHTDELKPIVDQEL